MKPFPLTDQPTDSRPVPSRRMLPRSPRLTPKQGVYVGLAIATVLLVMWAFRPAPVAVDTAVVERGLLQVTIEAEGKTRVRDRFTISAPVNGHLDRIQLVEGDVVQSGTLVARIDPLPLTAAVDEALGRLAEWRAQRAGVATQRPKPATLAQANSRIQQAEADRQQAEARVAEAQAAFNQARRDRQRAQQLAATGAISRQDREAAELKEATQAEALEAATLAARAAASEVEVARAALVVLQQEQTDPDYLLRVYDARIASTEAELAKLQDDANRTEIRSPVTGRVLRILQKSAQYVTSGTPLVEVGDVANLELVIDVLSTDAEQIKTGDRILLDQAEAQPLEATVRLVEPAAFTKVSALGVDEQRVNIIGDFATVPTTLGDAYRVDTRIVIWENSDVVKVPLSALFRCDSGWCVFTVENNRARRRGVEIDHHSQIEAEIQTGIDVGEVVILHPNEAIEDGKRVRSR